MVLPKFKLEQTETTVTIKVFAPLSDTRKLEIHCEKNAFIFSCEPYFLRLQLPGEIVAGVVGDPINEVSKEYTFTYRKVTEGEDFLRQPPKVKSYESKDMQKTIEQILHENNLQYIENEEEEKEAEYGFAMLGKRDLKVIFSEVANLFELNPFEVKFVDRCPFIRDIEGEKFSIDHYVADLMENEEITQIIKLQSPWTVFQPSDIVLEKEEVELIDSLPEQDYDLSDAQINYCLNSLLEILYAYCYDRRTTDFEGSVESSWTITKLSATLSCFDTFETPKIAILSSFRRSLIYPLFREFHLCKTILEDLKLLLALEDKFVIKCLLDIYKIMDDSERRILNELYIIDFIVFVKKLDADVLPRLAKSLENISIEKSEMDLNLLEIEEDAIIQKLNMLDLDEESSSGSETSSNCESATDSEGTDDTLT